MVHKIALRFFHEENRQRVESETLINEKRDVEMNIRQLQDGVEETRQECDLPRVGIAEVRGKRERRKTT